MATDYRWKLLKVGIDMFAHYRDGVFRNGVAVTEIAKGNIRQAA